MVCPNCCSKLNVRRALDLAKDQRIGGYVCPACGTALQNRPLPRSSYYKMAAVFLAGFLSVIPADFLWQWNLYVGIAYFTVIVIAFFSALLLWVRPKEHRQQPLEQVHV